MSNYSKERMKNIMSYYIDKEQQEKEIYERASFGDDIYLLF